MQSRLQIAICPCDNNTPVALVMKQLMFNTVHLYRAAATSIANWAEEQGGIPLFTIEGDSSDVVFATVLVGPQPAQSMHVTRAMLTIQQVNIALTDKQPLEMPFCAQGRSQTHPQQAGTCQHSTSTHQQSTHMLLSC